MSALRGLGVKFLKMLLLLWQLDIHFLLNKDVHKGAFIEKQKLLLIPEPTAMIIVSFSFFKLIYIVNAPIWNPLPAYRKKTSFNISSLQYQ